MVALAHARNDEGQSAGPPLGAFNGLVPILMNAHSGKAGHLSESRAALPDRKEPRRGHEPGPKTVRSPRERHDSAPPPATQPGCNRKAT